MNPTTTLDVERLERDDDSVASPQALALHHPATPVSLTELAALKGEAIEVIEARVQVLTTLRRAALRMTSPEDLVLYKAPQDAGGQVVSYLQECGCERIRDLYGVNVINVSKPEKLLDSAPGVFHYLISGDGYSTLTGQRVEHIEGGRSSTEDFCKGKTGAELELAVRKAARANLDGNITRELAGMKAIPLQELVEAWAGTNKKVEQCRLGRGFGSRDMRMGGRDEKAPDVDPPICPHCGTVGAYRPGKNNRPPFYGCPKYASHTDKKWIVDAVEWQRQQAQASSSASDRELDAEIARQPGQEG